MKSRLLLVLFSVSFLFACGGGNSSNSTTSGNVTITPASASVPINTTSQFSATVANSSAGVYWSVNDVVGGSLTTGTISSAGLYTAPAVIPSPATVTIKATSVSDSSQTATVKVTVTSGTALTITVTPSTASVYTGRTQQFTATFNSSNNTAVTWQVCPTTPCASNAVTDGNSTIGTISTTSTSGSTTIATYTAPTTVPSPAQVTITAISQADSTKTATATVTVVPGTVINISPNNINVPAGGTQTFTATANNQPITVTWAINCGSTQPSACGSITSAGVYTAPPFPPPGGSVSITASVSDGSALPAGATLTVQISNGSLNGQYAYAVSGMVGTAPYVSAGTIKFDGAGAIVSGSADLNNNGTITAPAITGGTYHIGTDGRGNAALQIGGTQNWQIILVDNTKAYLIRTDANTTGSGILYLQDPTTFTAANVTGNYALDLASPAGQTGTAAYTGVVTTDGAGGISGGKLDVSNGGSVSPNLTVSGSYGAPNASTGRGTMTVTTSNGTQNLAYYLVNGTRALAVDLDSANVVRGELVQQSGSPFSLASFAGNYAMVTSGWNTQGKVAVGAIFTGDGSGAITNGTADVNSNGNVTTQAATSGTYAVTDAATGRTEASVTIGGQARKFVVYPQATGIADALEIDGVQTTSGRMYTRSASADAGSSFQGTYSSALAGIDFVSPGEIGITGTLTPNGGSAISGSLDINDAGTIVRGATLQGSYVSSTPAGRKAGSWTTSSGSLAQGQFVYYVVDTKHALVLELDSNRVISGIMEKPY